MEVLPGKWTSGESLSLWYCGGWWKQDVADGRDDAVQIRCMFPFSASVCECVFFQSYMLWFVSCCWSVDPLFEDVLLAVSLLAAHWGIFSFKLVHER